LFRDRRVRNAGTLERRCARAHKFWVVEFFPLGRLRKFIFPSRSCCSQVVAIVLLLRRTATTMRTLRRIAMPCPVQRAGSANWYFWRLATIGAREETGKRREGTVASEPTLSPTSLVLSLPGRGWRGQPSARNHWLQHAATNEQEADFLTLVVGGRDRRPRGSC
jgi:hypothetical protein